MKRFFLLILVLLPLLSISQNIAITDDDTYTPDSSAMLDIKSVTKGLLIPRLTTTQRDSISSPADGLMVYDTDDSCFYYFTGNNWTNITAGNASDIFAISGDSVFLKDTTYLVGIGTRSPNASLSIENKSDKNEIELYRTGTTTSQFDINMEQTNWTNTINSHNSNLILSSTYAGATGGNIILDASNNVGIGIAQPNSKLHIEHSGAGGIMLERNEGSFANTIAAQSISMNNGLPGLRTIISDDNGSSWTDALFIQEDGNVGIGTTNPLYPLHLHKSSFPYIHITDDVTGQSSSDGMDIGVATSGTAIVWNRENTALRFGTNSTERMRIDGNGNVGIGTTSPSTRLEIEGVTKIDYLKPGLAGADYEFLRLGDSTTYFAGLMHNYSDANYGNGDDFAIFTYGDRDITFRPGNGNVIFFPTLGGKIGIGTTSPNYKLDVVGEITARSNNAFRLRNTSYSAFLRNDNTDFYLLLTNSGDPDGSWNSLRPFRVYLSSGNTLISNTLFAQHGGNVGIGTINPTSKLDISGGNIDINDGIYYLRNNTNNTYGMGLSVEGGTELTLFSDNYFCFTESDNDARVMTIDGNNGKVAIGKTTPLYALEVQPKSTSTDTVLFCVRDKAGNPVFLVYEDGAELIVPDVTKGGGKSDRRGTFAVSSRDASKGNVDIMDITKQNYLIGHNVAESASFSGTGNSVIGYEAGKDLTSGDDNVFIGYNTGMSNTSGQSNTMIGHQAGYSTTGGLANVFIGKDAGHDNIGGWVNPTYTGSYNVYVGDRAGYNNETGRVNVMIGCEAGYNNTGRANVFIGNQAGFHETGNFKLYIESSISSSPLIFGDFYYDRVVINGNSSHNSNNRTFFVNGSAGGTTAWFNDSDFRLKKNIQTITNPIKKVQKLRGVNYEWKDTEYHNKGVQIGFIAQEAIEVVPEVVSSDNDKYSMQYAPLTALLVEAIKEQQKMIDNITQSKDTEIDNLKKKNQQLEARLKAVEEYIKQQR